MKPVRKRAAAPGRRIRVVEITEAAIDRASAEPIYRQLVRFLRTAIAAGQIQPGAVLPPSRQLARQLAVSRATIVAAYDLLLSENLVETAVGAGTIVRPVAREPAAAACAPDESVSLGGVLAALEPRSAPMDHIQPAFWRRLVAGSDAPAPPVDGWRRGGRRLRDNIATHLLLSRGLSCTPDQIVIASSVQQVLTLIATIAREDGIAIHVEPLSCGRARRAFERQGASVATLPRFLHDDARQVADLGERAGVFTMPGCHYPLGVALLGAARQDLAAALDDAGAWAIEDGRDVEFLDDHATPTLHALRAGRRTFHVGALSAVLPPFVRLAYVVAPAPMAERLDEARLATDDAVPWAIQSAAAELLETGMFHALARSARLTAQRRRVAFYEQAARHRVWTLPPTDARRGLHGLLWIDPGAHRDAVSRTIASLDAGLDLAEHPGSRALALAMGFAALPDDMIADQVGRVARAIGAVLGTMP